jgi:hypothetical protein
MTVKNFIENIIHYVKFNWSDVNGNYSIKEIFKDKIVLENKITKELITLNSEDEIDLSEYYLIDFFTQKIKILKEKNKIYQINTKQIQSVDYKLDEDIIEMKIYLFNNIYVFKYEILPQLRFKLDEEKKIFFLNKFVNFFRLEFESNSLLSF